MCVRVCAYVYMHVYMCACMCTCVSRWPVLCERQWRGGFPVLPMGFVCPVYCSSVGGVWEGLWLVQLDGKFLEHRLCLETLFPAMHLQEFSVRVRNGEGGRFRS